MGEGATLGDRWDVGAVEGDDAVENVAGFSDVIAVGDHTDLVLLPAAGDRDVQAPPGRRRGSQRDAGADGVGFAAVLGRRIPEADMLTHILGGEHDDAVSLSMGHGQRAVAADPGDHPRFPVTDRVPGGGEEAAVVSSGGDDVTDVGGFAGGDRSGRVRVELAGGEPSVLHGVIDGVDVVVSRGDHRHRPAVLVVGNPGVGDSGEVLVEGAGDDPPVSLVGVEGARVAGATAATRRLPIGG